MPIYCLTPNKSSWPTNTFRLFELILVRAQSENVARKLVKKATHTTQRPQLGIDLKPNPWLAPKTSACHIYDGLEFLHEGNDEILFPPELCEHSNNLRSMIS